MNRIILRDVAARIGVSTMTVSRALRKSNHVSLELAEHIRNVAQQMGYRPDPMLKSLAAYRFRTTKKVSDIAIGYLTTGSFRYDFESIPFVHQSYLGAKQRSMELGFQLVPIWLPELGKRYRDPTDVLLARGIKGLILAPLLQLDAKISIRWEQFSVVAIGYSIREPVFNFAASHHFHNTCIAFDALIARDYRRPLLLHTADLERRTLSQVHGAYTLKQRQLEPKDRLAPLCSARTPLPGDLTRQIRILKPDVLISALGGIRDILQDRGCLVPQDLGYIELTLDRRDSEISGIFQDPSHIGRCSVDRLQMQFQAGEFGIPKTVEGTILMGEWISGATVRPATFNGYC